ncbi:hypothetical protein NAEX_01220 [Nannocystis exedens]|nr:hypothetical protein NAEX_01220 [Nannocystis exedens]
MPSTVSSMAGVDLAAEPLIPTSGTAEVGSTGES